MIYGMLCIYGHVTYKRSVLCRQSIDTKYCCTVNTDAVAYNCHFIWRRHSWNFRVTDMWPIRGKPWAKSENSRAVRGYVLSENVWILRVWNGISRILEALLSKRWRPKIAFLTVFLAMFTKYFCEMRLHFHFNIGSFNWNVKLFAKSIWEVASRSPYLVFYGDIRLWPFPCGFSAICR